LHPNFVNHLQAMAEDGLGRTSVPVPVDITHDAQLPAVVIDFPSDAALLFDETIDVAGRGSDMLSGLLGLEVEVNGQAADVHVGIGTNGTFAKGSVPLNFGDNVITATAIDAVGNEKTAQITVTRAVLTGPKLSIGRSRGRTARRFGRRLPVWCSICWHLNPTGCRHETARAAERSRRYFWRYIRSGSSRASQDRL